VNPRQQLLPGIALFRFKVLKSVQR